MPLEVSSSIKKLSAHSHWIYGAHAFSGYLATLDILHRPHAHFSSGRLELPLSPQLLTPREAYPVLKKDLAAALGQTVKHSVALQTHDESLAGSDIQSVTMKLVEEGYQCSDDILSANAVINDARPNPLGNRRFFEKFCNLVDTYPGDYVSKAVNRHLAEMLAGIPVDPQYK